MAADAWLAFNTFRERMADGTLDLDNDTFKMMLVLSTWTPNAETDSDYADISGNEHANANGYITGGVTVAATWTRSTVTVTFDTADGVWTASGGSIVARYAVIYDDTDGTKSLVCYSLLDNSPADVTATDGNQLTVQINASGVFTLTGMA
jgi:hypothetical protein